MFKVLFTVFSVILFSSFILADANFKDCAAALTMTKTGSLTITQGEPTDVRGLPGPALVQIVTSLRDHWVQITTREVLPALGNYAGLGHYLIQITGMGQGVRFGQALTTARGIIGESKESNLPKKIRNEIPTTQSYQTVEIFLSDITSIQLADDVPEIKVSLFNQMRSDGKPGPAKRFDEKISGLAEGDPEAMSILAELSDARYLKLHVKSGEEFETFVNLLDLHNIRGPYLVAAYREYAGNKIEKLISGIIEHPDEVSKLIHKNSDVGPITAINSEYKYLN